MRGRASTSSSFSYQWTYDVFINFRGEDTRYGFTGNLYKALCQKGIRTFMDDEELRKGDDITPTLLEAIEQSRMAITVFSKNYASSTFCLDELVKIIQCIKGNNRLVWPIFYDVDPSDVRHQKGNYKEALAKHLETFKADEEKVKSWKWALNNAANTSGLHFRHDQYEHQFIERIVQEISSKNNRDPLHIAEYPVGLSSRVLKINSLLRLGSNEEVNMVGICGIGGMGKTTIARAVYNSIADHFEGLCFLHDIKEESTKHGLAQMQERMLSKILGVNIKVEDVNEGIPIIKRRLNQKKILLILDNVDKREQLEKLAGECCWFGLGSRIIITTRDKHLLKRHGVLVNQIYEVEGFDDEESHQLLSWHAFKDNQFDPSYKEVLNCVVHYAQGLPLALEVIGSHLFRKSVNEWKAAIDIYRKIPDKDIQQILEVSYNNLTEVEQEIFLDIACFFKGAHSEYVKSMVEHAHDFDPSYGIGVLIDKCLIKIEYNCIRMHDLIRDIGREIVRKESPREPGKRSRLWFHMDIVHVLENNTGTDKINAIILEYQSKDIVVSMNEKAFKRMKNLKILILRETRFSKCPKYLPKSLRVLDWWGYPASSLQLLGQVKRMENLSVLDLCFCPFITQITDMSSVPNLTELSVMCCQNLIEIHDSVGYLRKLRVLNAWCCDNLRHFPRRMKLPALEHLMLSGCISLEKFPEIAEKMEYTAVLDLKDINLELPFSICNLTMLQRLWVSGNGAGLQQSSDIAVLQELKDTSIEGCEELQSSILHECQEARPMRFPNARRLLLFPRNISDGFLPKCLSWFVNVGQLNLNGSNFTILPACIKECRYLKWLYLSDCNHLREIKGIPPNIEELHATNCISLNSESRSLLMSHSEELLEPGNKLFLVPGSMMPESFSYRSKGPSLSFWFHDKCPNISFCCVLRKGLPHFPHLSIKVIINGEKIITFDEIFKQKRTHLLEDLVVFTDVPSEIIFKCNGIDIVSLASEWNHVEFCIFAVDNGVGRHTEYFYSEDMRKYVKEVGIHVKEEEIRREDFQFINPHKRKKLFHDFSLNLNFKASNRTCGIISDKGTHAKSQEVNESLKFTCKRDGYFTPTSKLKFEIAKVTYEGRLVDSEGAERFVQLMKRHSQNTESDWDGRNLLLQIIGNTNIYRTSVGSYSGQSKLHTLGIKALPLVNKWLQDVQKGKFDDTENDEFVEQFLLASFRALKKLPPESVYELQSCKIPESLRLLFKHKSSKIQREAQSVLDLWRRIMPGGMP